MDRLQLEDDSELQRRSWVIGRIAIVVFLLVILAATLGMTGSGPYARETVASPDGSIEVDYARVLRLGGPVTMTVALSHAADTVEAREIWLTSAYLDRFSVLRIVPEPVAMKVGTDRVKLEFDTVASAAGLRIVFEVEPRSIGRIDGSLGVTAGPSLFIRQWALP